MIDERALRGLQEWARGPGPGEVLGDRYELRQRIGEGGMGVVYAAHDRVLDRGVAIKILRGGGEQETARFEREWKALEKIAHPAVVRCIAHGEQDGSRYLVMERLEGCSLAERLMRGRLPVRQVLVLGRRIAEALVAVHTAGVTHRDVKPSNVFLASDSVTEACLLDFGIARDDGAPVLTARGVLVGTPGYMAPERVRAEERADPASDVFSLGCVLFECLVGRAPFTAETTYALLTRVLLEVAPLVREERPEAPLGLEALVEQMLAKLATERPDAAEVARTLAELEAALPASLEERVELAPGLSTGDIISGKYRIERKLGEGGMGVVVAARHLQLGTRVAIKFLRSGTPDEGRFLREAQAASRVESDHVARVLDVGRLPDGRPFIVMEHLRGTDLAHRLLEQGPMPVSVAVDHLLQACVAVAEAHALGIVHRDLKPSNLFIVDRRDGSELVKVLDFGISKVTRPLDGASVALTATADSTVMGSIAYMSPEQIESSSRADARSDIWSLGVVLFELITGSRPFQGDTAVAIAARIAGTPPRRLRDGRPDAPAGLEEIVTKCLARDPSARFASIDELAQSLGAFAGARGASALEQIDALRPAKEARAPSPAMAPAAPSSARRRNLVIAAALAFSALAFVILRQQVPAAAPHTESPPPPPVSVAALAPAAPPSIAAIESAGAPNVAIRASALASAPARPTVAPPAVAVRPAGPTPARSLAPVSPSGEPPRRDLDLRDPALQGR